MSLETSSWEAVAAARQLQVSSRIPEAWKVSKELLCDQNLINLPEKCGVMTDFELRITESRAVDIVAAVQKRQVTAVDVTRAFCKRAAVAHQATNCLAEVLFEEALAQAAELDEYMRVYGKPRGMLHGLPISVKEHIKVKNTAATSGLVAWADEISSNDALIVKSFREQGAIFHVKTTNPQTLMSLETNSNLFGRTVNPHNKNLTSGGSSGGESALLAMRGSVLGIGTDIGGSIRVPAAFCGIYGFKPSVGRMPHSGLSGLHDGMQNIIGVVGPMAHCVEDLEWFCTAALNNRPWDYEPSLVEIPWNNAVGIPARLKIGIIWNDGVVQPHPPVTRALKQVVSALEKAGHTVVDWDPHLHEEIFDVVNQAYFLDGGDEYYQKLIEGGEPPVTILKWLLDTKASRRYTVEESFRINSEMDRLRTLYAKEWNTQGIDAIICPANPSVASVHDESRYWGYSCVFNGLDYSAVSIPVSIVNSTDTWKNFPPASSNPLSPVDEWYRQLYDNAQGYLRYEDAPISVQIIGRRFQDEKVLKMASLISEILAGAHRRVVTENAGPIARQVGWMSDQKLPKVADPEVLVDRPIKAPI